MTQPRAADTKEKETTMYSQLRPTLMSLLFFTVLNGVLYPVAVTLVARGFSADEADGSLLRVKGQIVGSRLIGQPFNDPGLFWSRPSATSPAYNAGLSSGSNLGPINPTLREQVAARVTALHAADSENKALIPIDLVTTSASGLDPHISVAAAEYQIHRVAKARGLTDEALRQIVSTHTQSRTLGILGEPVVNVVELNRELLHGNTAKPVHVWKDPI